MGNWRLVLPVDGDPGTVFPHPCADAVGACHLWAERSFSFQTLYFAFEPTPDWHAVGDRLIGDRAEQLLGDAAAVVVVVVVVVVSSGSK